MIIVRQHQGRPRALCSEQHLFKTVDDQAGAQRRRHDLPEGVSLLILWTEYAGEDCHWCRNHRRHHQIDGPDVDDHDHPATKRPLSFKWVEG